MQHEWNFKHKKLEKKKTPTEKSKFRVRANTKRVLLHKQKIIDEISLHKIEWFCNFVSVYVTRTKFPPTFTHQSTVFI